MKRPVSPLEALATEPGRFGFDAAVRVLLYASRRNDPAEVARFRSIPGLAYQGADVTSVQAGDEGLPPAMTVSVMALAGVSGVLPRHYTEVLTAALRVRSHALHEFLDLLAQRFVAQFAQAGARYRPHRALETAALGGAPEGGDRFTAVLLALAGQRYAELAERSGAGIAPVAHFAGLFAAHPRSAERLRALASDWLGRPVEVREFAGAWLPIMPDQRTRLAGPETAGRFERLGVDAAIGVRTWDIQAGIVLGVGPLSRADFLAMLPEGPLFRGFVSLVQAYLGLETGFAVNPVLAADQVPPLRLAAAEDGWEPRLGWTTWLQTPAAPRQEHGCQAVFAAG